METIFFFRTKNYSTEIIKWSRFLYRYQRIFISLFDSNQSMFRQAWSYRLILFRRYLFFTILSRKKTDFSILAVLSFSCSSIIKKLRKSNISKNLSNHGVVIMKGSHKSRSLCISISFQRVFQHDH